jgi:hypothetical protein
MTVHTQIDNHTHRETYSITSSKYPEKQKKLKFNSKRAALSYYLSGSVMEITLTESENIKDIALLILNISGYSSTQDIWKLIEHHTGIQIPIGTYFFMASPEKTKEIVNDSFKNNAILKDMEARSKEIAEQIGNAPPF